LCGQRLPRDLSSTRSVNRFRSLPLAKFVTLTHSFIFVILKVVEKCLARDPSNAIGCDNMTIVIVGLLMGETDEVWQAKCKKVVTIDGVEVDPLKEEPQPEVVPEQDDNVVFDDPEQKYHF